MLEVLRISDRYFSDSNSGYFKQVFVLVLVFHMIMGICFMRMQEYERAHPRPIYNVDVSYLAAEMPREIELSSSDRPLDSMIIDGDTPDVGGQTGSKAHSEKLSVPSFKEPKEAIEQKEHTAQTIVSRQTNGQDAPLSIVKINQVKPEIPNENAKALGAIQTGSHTQHDASGTFINGGDPNSNGSSNAEEKNGNGQNGAGTGPSDANNGRNAGSVGSPEKLTTHVETAGGAKGNINPYLSEVLMTLRKNWHPTRNMKNPVTIRFAIDRDGVPLDVEVVSSSGSEKMNAEAVAAAEKTIFPPLPDWYKGQQLTFQIDMGQSVEF